VGAAAGALYIGVPVVGAATAGPWTQALTPDEVEINAWLVIRQDDTIIVRVGQTEMGQGVYTALPMIVAEELECDWQRVRPEYASVNRSIRENTLYGRMKTGGSSAVRLGYGALQQAGASARERLVRAAAELWSVAPGECVAHEGRVQHAHSQRSINYGAIARRAARIRLDAEPQIKSPEQFKLMGKRIARIDTPAKCNGTAVYGMDVRLPNMKFAAVQMCPVFGGTVDSFDASAVEKMPGMRSVHRLPDAVAVVADDTWTAVSAAKRLSVKWDEGAHAVASSANYWRVLHEALDSPRGVAARNDGDAAIHLQHATDRHVKRIYELPFLAHAAMEPPNCTALVSADRVDLWVGTQVPEDAIALTAEITGVPRERVYINSCFLGGSFGRRLLPDDIRQAVMIAKEVQHPVQLVWTRENDIRHDRYRPQAAIAFEAVLAEEGLPLAWCSRSALDSIQRSMGASPVADGLDHLSLDGLEKMPYKVPNVLVEHVLCESFVPLGPWRSVNSSQNGFALESFVDELAVASGIDAVEYRRRLLADHADWLHVLEVAADKGAWGRKLERGRGQGFAIFQCYGSIVAEVVEVSVSRNGVLRVERVVAAIDCGHVVNPQILESQVEGAIAFGLTAALYGEITVSRGRVEQSNFNSYKILRMPEMPRVEVHMALTGGTKWGGGGEPGTPPIAPAVANAIFAATGRRVRRLPLCLADLSWG
jgi:isoquinoline 1-oxidoreductase beta subunit